MTQVRETNLQGFEIIQVRHIGGHKEGYIRWIQVFFRLWGDQIICLPTVMSEFYPSFYFITKTKIQSTFYF